MSLGYRTQLCILAVLVIVSILILGSFLGIVSIGYFQDLEMSTQFILFCLSGGFLCGVVITVLLLITLGRNRLLALASRWKLNQD